MIHMDNYMNISLSFDSSSILISDFYRHYTNNNFDTQNFDLSHKYSYFLDELSRYPSGILKNIVNLEGHIEFASLSKTNYLMSTGLLRPFELLRLIGHNTFLVIYTIVGKVWPEIKPYFMGSRYNFGMPTDPMFLHMADSDEFIKPLFDVDFNKQNFFWYDFIYDPRTKVFIPDPKADGFQYSDFVPRFPDTVNRANAKVEFGPTFGPILGPVFDINDPFRKITEGYKRYYFDNLGDNFYSPVSFYLKPYQNMRFIPDFLDKFLYLTFSTHDKKIDCDTWSDLWLCVAGVISIYTVIGNTKLNLEFLFIAFNPFSTWWSAIIYKLYTPWIEKLFSFLPKVGGIPTSYGVAFGFMSQFADYLYHVQSVMPYVGSEGVLKTISIDGKPTEVLVFEGIPASWKRIELIKIPNGIEQIEHLSIPNNLRTYWYNEQSDLFKHMISFCDNANILPDQVPDSIHHFSMYHFAGQNFLVEAQRFFEMCANFFTT